MRCIIHVLPYPLTTFKTCLIHRPSCQVLPWHFPPALPSLCAIPFRVFFINIIIIIIRLGRFPHHLHTLDVLYVFFHGRYFFFCRRSFIICTGCPLRGFDGQNFGNTLARACNRPWNRKPIFCFVKYLYCST